MGLREELIRGRICLKKTTFREICEIWFSLIVFEGLLGLGGGMSSTECLMSSFCELKRHVSTGVISVSSKQEEPGFKSTHKPKFRHWP